MLEVGHHTGRRVLLDVRVSVLSHSLPEGPLEVLSPPSLFCILHFPSISRLLLANSSIIFGRGYGFFFFWFLCFIDVCFWFGTERNSFFSCLSFLNLTVVGVEMGRKWTGKERRTWLWWWSALKLGFVSYFTSISCRIDLLTSWQQSVNQMLWQKKRKEKAGTGRSVISSSLVLSSYTVHKPARRSRV